jgi:hypothetical protein
MKKSKPYWEMNTSELAAATREFDDPAFHPPAVKPTARQLAQQQRWRRKAAASRARLTLSLDPKLIAQIDDYAANHRMTFSDVVTSALQHLMRKKSA